MGLFKKEVKKKKEKKPWKMEDEVECEYRVLMVVGDKTLEYAKPSKNRKLAVEKVETIKSVMRSKIKFMEFKNGMARVKDISAVYVEDWPLLCG